MTGQSLIDHVTVSAYRVPTDAPEADGTLEWNATELVVVSIDAAGKTGLGYSYTAAKPAADLIVEQLVPHIVNQCALDIPKHWLAMQQQLRNAGRPGLGMMAISAVDIALWDLKAKLLDVPLSGLLGHAASSVQAYGSGGFTSDSDQQLQEQLRSWMKQEFTAVKIKIGTGVEADARRVALARDTVGRGIELMVDANGAYDQRSALQLIDAISDCDVSWLEEPVSSDDLPGLRWLRDRAPGKMAIAAGEYGWDVRYFHRMLGKGAVDVLQADASRCGYTGFLQTAAVAAAFNIPLSAHCAPALHAPLCASINGFRHLEYFYDHARIESLLFSGGAALEHGRLHPDTQQLGHGLTMRQSVIDDYRIGA